MLNVHFTDKSIFFNKSIFCSKNLFSNLQSVQETGFLLLDFIFPTSQSQPGLAPLFLLASLSINNLSMTGIRSNSFVRLLVHSLQTLTINTVLNVLTELFAISFLVVLLQFIHVLSYVTTEDVFAVGLSVEVVFFVVVAWESFGRVWDVEATVDGAFQSTEDFVSGGGSGETGVEEASEWAWAVFGWFYVVFVTVDFFLAFVKLVELHFGEESSSEEETGAVVSGVVGEADFDAEFGEFVGVSSANHYIPTHSWVRNLANNIPVGGSNDQSVFWGVEFVLVLSAESSSGLVIGFTDLSPLEFWLEPFEVSLVLLDFDQSVSSLFSSVSVFTGHFLGLPQFFYL